jgi:RNA polymerase sigma factor for flagellar operon FliA
MERKHGRTYNQRLPPLDDFIRMMRPLVKKISRNIFLHSRSNLEKDDLVQEGLIALMGVYQNFDPNKGSSILTYAKIRVRGAMLSAFRQDSFLSHADYGFSKKISEASRKIEQEMGRGASAEEVSYFLSLPISLIERTQIKLESFSEDNYTLLSSLKIPQEEYFKEDFFNTLCECFSKLSLQEQNILKFYFQDELLLKEIGRRIGVTESRVSQLRTRALAKMKKYLLEES